MPAKQTVTPPRNDVDKAYVDKVHLDKVYVD